MPTIELICLANSEKMRGRCIAGLRTDGQGWIRPIAPDTDHGQLFLRHFQFSDGTEPLVLDVVTLDLSRESPAPGQPENWLIGNAKWTLQRRPAPLKLYPTINSAVVMSPILLGSTQARIAAADATRLASSLALVRPSRLRWYLKRDLYDRLQPRVRFEQCGQIYDLPITDPAWKYTAARRLSQLESGYYDQDKVGIPAGAEVLLTISLSEAFNGYCYKLVAAVVVLPAADDRQ